MSPEHADYDAYYAKPHLNWSFSVRGKVRSFIRLAKRAGIPRSGVDVLDIGFGSGGMLLTFDPTCRVKGLESSRRAVDRILPLVQKRFVSADVAVWNVDSARLPVSSSSIDVVVASHILEHVDRDADLIAEARRVLRPGGYLAVMLPLDDPVSLASNVDHVRTYDRATAESLLSSIGFQIVATLEDHRVENVLRAINSAHFPGLQPRLRSRLVGAVSLFLALLPCSEGLPFPGPYRNIGVVAKKP